MGFGKMNSFIDIITTVPVKDPEGFVGGGDTVLASIRAYKEDKHGNERWANMAAFSEASSLFRFRKPPGLDITTDNVIACADGRYNILSVEDVRGRGMYIEVLAKKVDAGG
ncbi:phage head-tail adaptor, putative [Heliomicrobium modesticaldum Ice1]|uniref:Phage head-tail adaptor, putative n=1 Tax=Heliobacterium modesticaldum (strain ATCC 51547 / Ice1) TaxID=498761 RepID=B0TD21_HELMI|nr:head-tail adaptor protein [Heliomicrobium modesticaldum]ABZ85472.1 phage head-tail adaptor, putative [Heliomicrobium modesticaldum Ice1]